jgi:Ca2+-binding RTX toxin-like protein
VPGDDNGFPDVFLHDRDTGITERVHVSSSGEQSNDHSGGAGAASVSDDGRLVTFTSTASNLVVGDGPYNDVLVRDRAAAITGLVTVGAGGSAANATSQQPAMSPDGDVVIFGSLASNLVAGDTNGIWDVFARVRDPAGDGDGLADRGDNCLAVANADQADSDTDGFGDACDADFPSTAALARCTIMGGPGPDRLRGTTGPDVICGLGGRDTIEGLGAADVLRGGTGHDRLYGGGAADELDGGDGRDYLSGGTGSDELVGGRSVDRASYFTSPTAVTITIGDGPNDGAPGEGDDVQADAEQVAGGRGDDVLVGNQAENRLSGNDGADEVTGGSGYDYIIGGAGDDRLDGADGEADRFDCGAGTDSVLRDPVDSVALTGDS